MKLKFLKNYGRMDDYDIFIEKEDDKKMKDIFIKYVKGTRTFKGGCDFMGKSLFEEEKNKKFYLIKRSD